MAQRKTPRVKDISWVEREQLVFLPLLSRFCFLPAKLVFTNFRRLSTKIFAEKLKLFGTKTEKSDHDKCLLHPPWILPSDLELFSQILLRSWLNQISRWVVEDLAYLNCEEKLFISCRADDKLGCLPLDWCVCSGGEMGRIGRAKRVADPTLSA